MRLANIVQISYFARPASSWAADATCKYSVIFGVSTNRLSHVISVIYLYLSPF